jgi:transposase
MALGRRREEQQQEFWIATSDLPRSVGHVFYRKLNQLLSEAEFDPFVEQLCEPYYHEKAGRPGIPPGIYFRMLLVGYFEGIGSQRGIAWRCADSLSIRDFLGVPLSEETPDHSSLTRIRDRLPVEIHLAAFQFVLEMADSRGLLKGKTVAVDATTLEANAAMKSIIRRDTGEDWKEYVTRLMRECGAIAENEEPTVEEIARFDRKREDKKVSNVEWVSATDPDSRITKMKDTRTHLAYKAEHALDLDSEMLLAAEVYHADESDPSTIGPTLCQAQDNLIAINSEAEIEEGVADKGYFKAETLAELEFTEGFRTYVAEPKQRGERKWNDKPAEHRQAFMNNRRRTRGKRGRALQRQRSEKVERSFAHVCETGGSRRTWLWGIEKVKKRYLVSALAHNLGVIMRRLFGIGTPRSLQAEGAVTEDGCFTCLYILRVLKSIVAPRFHFWRTQRSPDAISSRPAPPRRFAGNRVFSTGC